MAYYVVIFRSRLHEGVEGEYASVAEKMENLVKKTPGYLDHHSYQGIDGQRVTVSRFASESSIKEWHKHAEHVKAQELGKEKFYSEYSVEVAKVERYYRS